MSSTTSDSPLQLFTRISRTTIPDSCKPSPNPSHHSSSQLTPSSNTRNFIPKGDDYITTTSSTSVATSIASATATASTTNFTSQQTISSTTPCIFPCQPKLTFSSSLLKSSIDSSKYPLATAPIPSCLQNFPFDSKNSKFSFHKPTSPDTSPFKSQSSPSPRINDLSSASSAWQHDSSASPSSASIPLSSSIRQSTVNFLSPGSFPITSSPVCQNQDKSVISNPVHQQCHYFPNRHLYSASGIEPITYSDLDCTPTDSFDTDSSSNSADQPSRIFVDNYPTMEPSLLRNQQFMSNRSSVASCSAPRSTHDSLASSSIFKRKCRSFDICKSRLKLSSSRQVQTVEPRKRLPLKFLSSGSELVKGETTANEPRESSFSQVFGTFIAGVSPTPPILEDDLESYSVSDSHEFTSNSSHSNSAYPLTGTENSSLPSPSLSPIAAAASVSGNGALGMSSNNVTSGHNELDFSYGSRRRGLSDTIVNEDVSRNSCANRFTRDGILSSNLPAHQLDNLDVTLVKSMPYIFGAFEKLSEQEQAYFMFQILRRSSKSLLHFVADVVNPALKIDFLTMLPLELGLRVLDFLDVQSLCRAASVSKKWRRIVDTNEKAWLNLLKRDGYDISMREIDQAIDEGWGWQDPYGDNSCEINLRTVYKGDISDEEYGPSTIPDTGMLQSSYELKRKASLYPQRCRKRRRTNWTTGLSSLNFEDTSNVTIRPYYLSQMGRMAIPEAEMMTKGNSGSKNFHLFKSLYRRSHAIRRNWIRVDAPPRHLAFRAHQRHVVTCLQFDSEKILTGSDDTNIHVYDTRTGAKLAVLSGHEGGVWALQYDGNILVSGSTDRSVRVWNIKTGKCLHVFQGHTSTVRCLLLLKPTVIGYDSNGRAIVMPKKPLIITGSRDSTLRVWKLPGVNGPSVLQSSGAFNDTDNPYFVRVLSGHHHSVRTIAAHGDTLVSGSYDNSVRVWRISTGEMRHRLFGHASKVYSVVLDYERSRCISGSMDSSVKIWDIENGTCIANLEGHSSLVGLLELRAERLVSAAADSTLRIWDTETGQCRSTLLAHTGAITCFQHDGEKVISGSVRSLKIWDIRTGKFLRDLLTDLSGVWQVKFDNRRCVAAVQRDRHTYIEVLDFGASRDQVDKDLLGVRTLVDDNGRTILDADDTEYTED